jgi:hypothetical protein
MTMPCCGGKRALQQAAGLAGNTAIQAQSSPVVEAQYLLFEYAGATALTVR